MILFCEKYIKRVQITYINPSKSNLFINFYVHFVYNFCYFAYCIDLSVIKASN